MRYVPFALVVFYFSVAVAWRAWLHARRYGTTGLALFGGGRDKLADAAALLLPILLVIDALVPWAMPSAWGVGLGVGLVLLSLALMIVAQLDLGASWRIGIDVGARPGLVTDGAYGLCRNPIFSCAFVGLLGFALLLPNALTLTLCGATMYGVHRQVVAEESYLSSKYGDDYCAYVARVPRYVPVAK